MTSKHTPGPWVAHSLMVSEAGQPVGRGRDICHCGIGMRLPSDGQQSMANARLIAAAPELLEACQTFAEWLRREAAGSEGQPWAGKRDTPEGEAAWSAWWYENLRICDLAQEQVRAAIAKATGAA